VQPVAEASDIPGRVPEQNLSFDPPERFLGDFLFNPGYQLYKQQG